MGCLCIVEGLVSDCLHVVLIHKCAYMHRESQRKLNSGTDREGLVCFFSLIVYGGF